MEKRFGTGNWNILLCSGQKEDKDPAKEAEGYLVSEKENQMDVASGSCVGKRFQKKNGTTCSFTLCIAILLVCLTTGDFLKNYRRELKLGKWEILRGGGHVL